MDCQKTGKPQHRVRWRIIDVLNQSFGAFDFLESYVRKVLKRAIKISCAIEVSSVEHRFGFRWRLGLNIRSRYLPHKVVWINVHTISFLSLAGDYFSSNSSSLSSHLSVQSSITLASLYRVGSVAKSASRVYCAKRSGVLRMKRESVVKAPSLKCSK